MATELLYHRDSLAFGFTARVVAHGELGDRASVILDRTAFYPEAGGQMADRGVLAGASIRDVQIDDAGVVHHVVEGAVPAVGAEVVGEVDGSRRRLFMALHTGQHMLSRALADECGAETVSARLGETTCTLDVDQPALDEGRLARAEALVNSCVDDDLPVRAFFPTAEELAKLPLRRRPKVDENVRVVAIGDFDVSPCGGTHCTTTAQVGLVRVVGVERYKGKIRISFAAGRRARQELAKQADALRALAATLTCGPLDASAAVERLRRERLAATEALGRVRGRLAAATAVDLVGRAAAANTDVIVAELDDADVELVRAVATAVLSASQGRPPRAVLLGGRSPEGIAVLAVRPDGSGFDCGAFVKRAAALGGGRGGGRPDRAEGRLPAEAIWTSLAAAALGR